MAKKRAKKSTRPASKAKRSTARRGVDSGKASKESRDVLAGVEPANWRARIASMVFPKAGYLPDDVESVVDSSAMAVADDILRHPDRYGLNSVRAAKRNEVVMVPDDFVGAIQHAFRAGFYMAVRLHQRELEVVPDAATIVRGQRLGKAKSAESQSQRKQSSIAAARELAKAGKSVADIVDHFRASGRRVGQSTVYRWLNDGI